MEADVLLSLVRIGLVIVDHQRDFLNITCQ